MPACTQCGEYTKFNGGLCLNCFNKKKVDLPVLINEDIEPELKGGLSDDQKKYRYNMIKGRTLDFEVIMHYQRIIKVLTETDRVMKEIDGVGVV